MDIYIAMTSNQETNDKCTVTLLIDDQKPDVLCQIPHNQG